MAANPDAAGFGVYLHWPFCAQKCPYCDFNSHVRALGVDEDRFLAAFKRELAWYARQLGGRAVSSIFIGGGTPSLLHPRTVAGLLEGVAGSWTVENNAEISLEANPNSVEADRFAGYKAAGINRVSIGVQALDDVSLKALGRLHSSDEARAAIEIACRTFDNTSFDLIYARPKQSLADWRRELGEALALAGNHLSLYQLTIEAGTAYASLHAAGKLTLPEDRVAEEMYAVAQDLTQSAGMPAYEISNHARAGCECRHNLLYWRYGEYAGVGPGAHGRVVIDGKRIATETERLPERWLQRVECEEHGSTERQGLTREQMADEALLMGLRVEEGLDLDRLASIGGLRPSSREISRLELEGLLKVQDGERLIAATRSGRMVLNAVIARLAHSMAPVN